MPNALAFLMLAIWPVVTAVMFWKLPVGRAILASMLLGYLFLPPPPTAINLPVLPPLTKELIPSIVVMIACLVLHGGRIAFLPANPLARILVLLFIFSPVGTVLTNGEPVVWGRLVLPGLGLRDMIVIILNQIITIGPFLLALNFLRSDSDHRDILWALLLCGLAYSLPMLIEVRLSPQVNTWVYGFFQHSWLQMIRFGGFRPIVFLYHGLWVALFAMMAVLAAAAIARSELGRNRMMLYGVTGYLFAVLVLCKSVAALLYALAALPLVLLMGQKTQLRVAALLAFVALAYPLFKGADLVPEAQMLELAEGVDADRAQSLGFRFYQERILLQWAEAKPLFGWGTWGRNQIFDGATGEMISVTDGRWVLVIGILGWAGFLAEFGLLTLPIILIWYQGRLAPPGALSPWIGPLVLILALNLTDMLPNATITPLTWLFAGAVLGRAERAFHPLARQQGETVAEGRQVLAPLRTIL